MKEVVAVTFYEFKPNLKCNGFKNTPPPIYFIKILLPKPNPEEIPPKMEYSCITFMLNFIL